MLKCSLYIIEINQERNCYNCEKFEYIARYSRNQRFIGQKRRMKYEHNHNTDELKEKNNLVVFN